MPGAVGCSSGCRGRPSCPGGTGSTPSWAFPSFSTWTRSPGPSPSRWGRPRRRGARTSCTRDGGSSAARRSGAAFSRPPPLCAGTRRAHEPTQPLEGRPADRGPRQAAALPHPRARITAFEADPSIYQVMVENLRRNGATDVETVQAAVWNKTGEIEFHSEGADSGAIATRAHRESGAIRPVPSLRLRDVLDDEPVDLLKLDIEGSEAAVLDDCRGALGNVRALALDLHEFDPAHRQTGEVLDLLADE